MSTLIRASLPRSSLRHRRHSVDGSSLPAAFPVRRASNAAFCREYAVRRTSVRKPHTHVYILHPFFPGRDHSRSPKARPNTCAPLAHLSLWLHTLQVRTGNSRGCTRRCLARSVRSSSRAFQRYYPRVSQPPSWLPTFESGVQNHVCPPFLTATLCPDRGTAEPSCTPSHVPRVQPKHPCIACRTHPARAVLVPRPEHARTHAPPCCPHVAGAHVSGSGWRLPVCEKTFFGAISTCAPASSQRCHVRVRLLPCAVASCCLLSCLAVWPVRG